jgi:oxygen-independent coproporphyrinogen-3 oxidase
MQRLLSGLNELLKHFAAPAEFTAEANPESADEAFLRTCADGGVNRISLGLQSFHEPSRRAVRRAGDHHLLDERIALAAEYFPGAFSVDLIAGLPLQTAAILENDIKRALSYQPAHVSLYSLILEPETPLGKQVLQYGKISLSLPQDDDADNVWIFGRDMLEQSGYTQYEVSNFALPGKTCAHNIRYWRMENWLGAGPSASGTLIDEETGTGRRYTYQPDIEGYIAAPGHRIRSAQIEELSRADLIRESLLMGFRYSGGPDPVSFRRRFGCGIEDCIPKTISRWQTRGFFDNPGLAPSAEGLLFLNSFLSDAFTELADR